MMRNYYIIFYFLSELTRGFLIIYIVPFFYETVNYIACLISATLYIMKTGMKTSLSSNSANPCQPGLILFRTQISRL